MVLYIQTERYGYTYIDLQIEISVQRYTDREIWIYIDIQKEVDTDTNRDIWRERYEERDMMREI